MTTPVRLLPDPDCRCYSRGSHGRAGGASRHRHRRRSPPSWWVKPSTCAGFTRTTNCEFATDGKAVGSPQKGSFALSAVEIDKVKFTKHSMEIEAHRVGLHFFGALPYEDDTKPFERIKVDPKKTMNIEIDRLVIEPEKKKKKKDEKKDEKDDKKDGKEIATKPWRLQPQMRRMRQISSLPARLRAASTGTAGSNVDRHTCCQLRMCTAGCARA